MDKFLKEYSNHQFDDEGAVCSADFRSFAKKFKNYLSRTLPPSCEILNHRCGHYDLSGFVRQGGKYMYYTYSWNRYSPVDVYTDNYLYGAILVRTCRDEKDYRGDRNQYVSIAHLPEKITEMLV